MTATVCWTPEPDRIASAHLTRLIDHLRRRGEFPPEVPTTFAAIHQWSIDHPDRFWAAVWEDADILSEPRPDGTCWDAVFVGDGRMVPPGTPGAGQWFPGARLNFAENLLRHTGADDALISWDENGCAMRLSRDALRAAVARVAGGLRVLGVGPGDRVAGWVPNTPHAVIAMLATVSLGAVWTSCSPDFGVDGVVDRFGQTEPTVLFYCDGYQYGGTTHDCLARARELLPRLPSVRHAVQFHWHGDETPIADSRVMTWEALEALDPAAPLSFTRLPFDHPLYILYSSGTTGLPKCLVHGAGGTLLQHLKEHRLHGDLRAGERLFYFTTCGWMMWNWQMSALALGATLVLYDGAPMPPQERDILWRLAAAEQVTVFGTSARYLIGAEKMDLHPRANHDLHRIRQLLSTGSPLPADGFDWVRQEVGPQVQVASISGGTDIVSCFVLGNPLAPVLRGEIQGPGLGMAVDVYREDGTPAAVDEAGELVCTAPFPAMPVTFWNDPEAQRYTDAYFSHYPGVWRHGDWITRTVTGGFVISGRSDATLNPGGVRIGTAEIYRQVETIPAIAEALVIGQRIPGSAEGDVRIVLFVRLQEGADLTDDLARLIRTRIREGASPHHVPRVIVPVTDLPRTRSGKLSELAVRDMVEGRPVANVGALANPEALAQFRNRPELAG